MGVCRLNIPPYSYAKYRRIDFRLIPMENYWCGMYSDDKRIIIIIIIIIISA
jgi:hypothetical protein